MNRAGSATRRLSLGGDAWTLTYRTRVDEEPSIPGERALDAYRTIPAAVPGSIELDLIAAGELADPFVSDNVREAWELDYGDWWYERDFVVPHDWDRSRLSLLFHGLDTIADVFVNGTLIGGARNMMIPHEMAAGDAIVPGTNRLTVHLRSVLRYAERFPSSALLDQVWGDTPALWIRKPAHMFGWDISPRLISAGIHRGVELVERSDIAIADWLIQTRSISPTLDSAVLDVHYELTRSPRGEDWRVVVAGRHASGATFEGIAFPVYADGRLSIRVDDPHLWQPRNYGEPHVYDLTVTLLVDGEVADRHEGSVGIRVVQFDHDLAPYPDGRFGFTVNGRTIPVMGTNWVPLDAIHARDAAAMPEALALLWESGCTLVRCWGGNLYEDRAFFDWCDRHGIMVWQDFAITCGRYPQSEPFLSELAVEAEAVVRAVRNHPSLVIWCGSNETDDSWAAVGLDPDDDVVTRITLPQVVRTHDPGRAYIACSPAYSGSLVRERRTTDAAEQHLWGERASFKAPFYAHHHARFVSEIGFHGSPNESSLDRFLPEGHREVDPADPIWILHESDARAHPVWRYSRTQLMVDQARLLFPEVPASDRAAFVMASQVSQAEALKFWIESARLRGDEQTGLIWWNLRDCWPQVSDAIVDYYGDRKLAFDFVRRSQQPVCIAAAEADGWGRDVVLLNDTNWTGRVSYSIRSSSDAYPTFSGAVDSIGGQDRLVARLPLVSTGDCHLFEWRTENGGGSNHYTEWASGFDLARYAQTVLSAVGARPDQTWTGRPR